MSRAIEQMRGGAQSHLMRYSDGNYDVVKSPNNPQHRRILVNEMLGTRLASRLGLPTAPVNVVEVPEELDETLSNALQLAPLKGTYASDLDAETEGVYANHVAPLRDAVRGHPWPRELVSY